MFRDVIIQAVSAVPEVKQYLSPRARWMLFDPVKSEPYFLQNIERLVQSVYDGQIGGQFIDIMANLISGQLLDAYQTAWNDEGYFTELPPYLTEAYTADVVNQYSFVDQFYRDIIDARVDGTPIAPLMARAQMWSNRYKESYNNAIILITKENGGNLEWTLGEAEHCNTCISLSGIVAGAKEWDMIGIKPQSDRLECHGYNCKCELVPTDKRRSPNAYGRIEEAIL